MTLNIPDMYQERVKSIRTEDGLINGCKYVLTFSRGWAWDGYGVVPAYDEKDIIYYLINAKYGRSAFVGVMDCWE